MKEKKADLFETIMDNDVDAICITTNGQYTLDGRAAMGGGCAGVCAKRWPDTAVRLGQCLKNFGTNVPYVIGAIDSKGNYLKPSLKMIKEKSFKCLILSFPTINNLMDGANLDLIKQSAQELKAMVYKYELNGIVCPRPGVGIGGLNWSDVKPVLEEFLDDKFTIVSFDHEEA
jgi:hypothetical protein